MLILPKTHRHSLGSRIDDLFVETIEGIATAAFLSPVEKLPYVKYGVRKLDTLKILLMILWETKSLDDKKYIALSERLNEIGRMLGGWQGQLQKKTLP
ncbi:MAG: four helix bundle protein [Candidatus Moraniibacteriota bacterium]|nr:MAG: four helix bundle protein [Candidatus Moranbacteria bacterium]